MTILCGTDLSPASMGALDVALVIAKKRGGTEVVVVYVADPDGAGQHSAREDALLAAREKLDALLAAHTFAGGPTLRGEVVVGPPDETLIAMAETEHAELIVLRASSTDNTFLRLGTTTSKVVARATVPVLIVRDPEPWLAFGRGERPLRTLIGVDDSAACALGIQWTQALRATGPVDVVLGAVYYPDDAAARYGLAPGAMVDRDPEVEKLLERDLLRRFNSVHGAADAGVTPRTLRGLGRIGDHMIELAKAESIDLIVVGTNQKTGFGRLGSVSSVIANDAPQSVVCVPPQAHVGTHSIPVFQTALVATDLSDFANRAVPYAFALVPTGTVHILHVAKKDDELDEAAIRQSLAALSPTLPTAGAARSVVTHIVRGDDAAACIAQTAARLGVDVICIASHGRSGLTRALVGSVADRLLRETRLPVLVLRPS